MVQTTTTTAKYNNVSAPVRIVNLFLLDTSGSMRSIRDKIISGYNEQLQHIKKLDLENGTESLFGLVTFDSTVKVRYLNEAIQVAEELTHASYNPDGGTAFYDALVIAINALEDKLGSDLNDVQVLVTAFTDGENTVTIDFSASQAADLIKHFQEEYKWTFSFVGANIDVEALAKSLNVPTSNALNFAATDAGTQFATESLNLARTAYYSRSLNGEDNSKSFFHADQQTK